jgi:hypothetical protein
MRKTIVDFSCRDCGVDTSKNGEYYMVTNQVWSLAKLGRGMLCIGCLESRIGRQLKPADFMDAYINHKIIQSERLKNRLGVQALTAGS